MIPSSFSYDVGHSRWASTRCSERRQRCISFRSIRAGNRPIRSKQSAARQYRSQARSLRPRFPPAQCRPRGADRMRGGADGKPHLHLVAHADALEEHRQQHRANNTGEHHRDRGDRRKPAQHFRKGNCDRRGPDLGMSERMVVSERPNRREKRMAILRLAMETTEPTSAPARMGNRFCRSTSSLR